jgi:hypothetical protein
VVYNEDIGGGIFEDTVYIIAAGGGPGAWEFAQDGSYPDCYTETTSPYAGSGGGANSYNPYFRYVAGSYTASIGNPGTLTITASNYTGGNGGARTSFYGISGSGGVGGSGSNGSTGTGVGSGAGGGGKSLGGTMFGGANASFGYVRLEVY